MVDQVLKIITRHSMDLNQSIPILGDWIKITYIENNGMAFGLLAGKQIFLIAVTFILIIAIAVAMKIYADRFKKVFGYSCILVIAGGLSNLFDRAVLGSVTDYIDVKYFAIFNFADICAVVGCILLGISILFFEKKINV